MSGLVSVIVPVYNREQYIKDCIDSVLAQTYENFEMVIVDDGSVDNTAAICEIAAEKDKRIKFFKNEHGGISATRNKAMDVCRGDYLFFLDSDDVIHLSLLEDLVYGMEAEDVSLSATGIYLFEEKDFKKFTEIEIGKNLAPGTLTRISNQKALELIFKTTTPINMIGGVMMRRDLVGDTRFNTDFFIGEDFLFIYENLIKGTGVAFLNEVRYYERLHGENISYRKDFSGFYSRFMRRVKIWESEEKMGRTANANAQKRDAFSCYSTCLKANKPYGNDAKEMRKVVKKYKGQIFPSLSLKVKILFLLAVYMPFTYLKINRRRV